MENQEKQWGVQTIEGEEMWDAKPIFTSLPTYKSKCTLFFYPKKYLLYRYIQKEIESAKKEQGRTFRILDVGCATGASVIDMAHLFGNRVEVYGIDLFEQQMAYAQKNIKTYAANAVLESYDGQHIPFEDGYFDIVYSSDVLGHVRDVPHWLSEIVRVTKRGGLLALFSESTLGKHAYIRNYLLKKGINTDPHKEFHISLYSKQELIRLVEAAGFDIEKIFSTVWAKFFVHPDELYPALHNSSGVPVLKTLNATLYYLKKWLHPFSTALAELYSLLEIVTLGRWVESQGYIITAKKKS